MSVVTEGDDQDTIVLPWWRNPLNIVLASVLAALLLVSLGFQLGSRSSMVAHNDVDSGFLQDMRIHHEQAVTMASIYLNVSADEPTVLRTIAREIMFDQSTESGRMVQMLRMFGEAETNETDTAMGWMGMPVPLETMPGYASDAQLEELSRATGDEADKLFVSLMVTHHQGGVHMAEYVVTNGKNTEVAALARAIVTSQNSEIGELKKHSPS